MFIKHNNKIVKQIDKWCQFGTDGIFTDMGIIYRIGEKTDFNWIHQTGIFTIEFDYIKTNTITTRTTFLANRAAGGSYGIWLIQSNSSVLRVYFANSAGFTVLDFASVFTSTDTYKIRLIGNGLGIEVFYSKGTGPMISKGFQPYSYPIPPGEATDSLYKMSIGGYNTTRDCNSKMRNIKFYRDINRMNLHSNFTLQDENNIGKDVIQGIEGSVSTNIVVKDISTHIINN